jgi:hypothetical protein
VKLAGDVAWAVQPDGVAAVTVTFRIVVDPALVTVAVAVVCWPEVSVGSVCCPGAVLATCTPTVGLADRPSRTSTWWLPRSMVTVCVAAL